MARLRANIPGPFSSNSRKDREYLSRLERIAAKGEADEAARLARLDANYWARVDKEADRIEEAEANAAKAPPLDPVVALEQRLERDRKVKEAVAKGEIQPFKTWEMVFKGDVQRRLQERKEARQKEHEAELGLPQALDTWTRAKDATELAIARERAEQEQRNSEALAAIPERRWAEFNRKFGPEPTRQLLEQQKLATAKG